MSEASQSANPQPRPPADSAAHSKAPSKGKFLYLRLLWSNLGTHPLRSALSAIAIGLQIFLIMEIVGLTSGMLHNWRAQTEGVGADIILQPPGSSLFFAFSSAVIPQSLAAQIARIPGVDEVAPVIVVVDAPTLGVVYGIDYNRYNGLGKGFTFLAGGPFTGENDAIADDLAARDHHLKVGDTLNLMKRTFRLSGIVVHGKGSRYYVPLSTAQEVAGAEDRVSLVYIRSLGDTQAVRNEILRRFPNYQVRSMDEFMSLMTSSSLPQLTPFIRSFVGLGVVISFLVILLTMYTMVLERTREIGILKALGCSGIEICSLIFAEAFILVAIGSLIGLISAYGVTALLSRTAPTLLIELQAGWIWRSLLVGLVGALVGAAYPALRAARSDPVDALAYE